MGPALKLVAVAVLRGGRRRTFMTCPPERHRALLLIERGERHEIRNTGRQLLKTLNFYSPPAYTAAGDELPAAKPSGR